MELISARGVCIDPERTGTLDAVVTKIAVEAEAIGVRAGFIRGRNGLATADPLQKLGRPGTICQAAKHALVTAAYGGDPPRNKLTDIAAAKGETEGSVKADRDVLMSTGDPDLIDYASVGASLTLARTYVPILREGIALGPVAPWPGAPCGPVTSSPNILVASGRVSWRDPNWTNPPRSGGFRECVVPRPGCTFVACDFGHAEFRGLGQICLWQGFGDSIAAAFHTGLDVHLDFAADSLGITYREAHALHLAGDGLVVERRQVAKVANYGFPGGMGAERFVVHARNQGVILHPDRQQAIGRAWELRAGFRSKWPEVIPYFDWIGRQCNNDRRFTARQFVSGRLRGGLGYCDGCNTYFQGLIADSAKAAAWRIARACYGADRGPHARALVGSYPVLVLHAEIILEVPCGDGTARYPLDAAHLTDVAAALSAIMISAMTPYIPDIPIEALAAAMLRWVKGPKPKHRGGLLVPHDLPEGAVFA